MKSRPTTDPPRSAPPPPFSRPAAVPPECSQFDFLIGEWDTETTRFAPDGSVAGTFPGRWRAEHRDGGRMLVDEFTALAPDGGVLAFFVTLRSWCPATQRWEMTFLTAHQPFTLRHFRGVRRDGELHLEAAGRDPEGREALARVRFHDIEADGFAWEQQLSYDGSTTWSRSACLRARRRAAGGAPRGRR